MRRAARFALALVVGLGLVTVVGYTLVQRTTRRWFEKDLRLRAQLAVSGARQALVTHWRDANRDVLSELLDDITRDERIMATAACGADLSLLASTRGFPSTLSCGEIGAQAHPAAEGPDWSSWEK